MGPQGPSSFRVEPNNPNPQLKVTGLHERWRGSLVHPCAGLICAVGGGQGRAGYRASAHLTANFAVICQAKLRACRHRGLPDECGHYRLRRSWRHLGFCQFEAWLHAEVPRVACTGCGKRPCKPACLGAQRVGLYCVVRGARAGGSAGQAGAEAAALC